jgi:hypothetical protein
MPAQTDEAKQSVMRALLEENGLTTASRLYRETENASLAATDRDGVYRLDANAQPSESVVDIYGAGYIMQAEEAGPGLAFIDSASPNWQETVEMRTLRASQEARAASDRVEVEVSVEEILNQGGLMYPVESVAVEKAWYFTLPSGFVEVRRVP